MTERLEEILNDLPSSIRYSGELESLKKYAREQAERARELEETNKKNYWIAADFKFENLQLEQQNKRLKQVLEFYANEKNYERAYDDEVLFDYLPSEIDFDNGEKARKELGKEA